MHILIKSYTRDIISLISRYFVLLVAAVNIYLVDVLKTMAVQ